MLLVLGLFIYTINIAQVAQFDSEGSKRDFVYNMNVYADAFIAPVLASYSTSQLAANYTTAKVLKPFAFGIGIGASGTQIAQSDLKFNFDQAPFTDNMQLTNPDRRELPTILGGITTQQLSYTVTGQSSISPGNSFSYSQTINALDGITIPADLIPAGAIYISAGLPMHSEVYVRALPEIDLDGVKNYMIGFGGKHEVSPYFLTEESDFHIALAGFYGRSKFSFVPETDLEGKEQEVIFLDRTYSVESIFSFDKKFFSFFGLVGYYSGSTQFQVNGTYAYNVEAQTSPNGPVASQEVFNVQSPVNLSRSSSGVHAAFGASAKIGELASLTFNYHVAQYNSMAVNLRFFILNRD